MAYRFMRFALKARGVGSSAKAVLLALAQYADDKGRCFPSQTTLAADTGYTDRTVRSALAELEQGGLIVREHRQRLDGSRTSDLITLIDRAAEQRALAKMRRLPLVSLMDGGLSAQPAPVHKPDDKSGIKLGITEIQPETISGRPTGKYFRA